MKLALPRNDAPPADPGLAWRAACDLTRWVQDRVGVRNLAMVRRLANGDRAAAAVWRAVTTHDQTMVREALDGADANAVCHWTKELCCAWIGPGRDGRWYCCRIWSQEQAVFDDLADAVLWCVEGVLDVDAVAAPPGADSAFNAATGAS